jgi:pyroglutamyl-peptidase
LTSCIVAAVAGLLAVTATAVLCGCAGGGGATAGNPNANMFRDFIDGKFDGDGHPVNASVVQASALCPGRAARDACQGALPGAAQYGELVANARIKVDAHAASGELATLAILDSNGTTLASATLTVDGLRSADWFDFPMTWDSSGAAVSVRLVPAAGTQVELDYVEVFPQRFGLVMSPGSGVTADSDQLEFELPLDRPLDRLSLDGTDVTSRLQMLLDSGEATRTTTDFRAVVDVAVGDLAAGRADVSQLEVRAQDLAARVELRATPPACAYEGDATRTKVLVTGFQPFPADADHDNVSGVAVTALDASTLHGARVMRLVVPVEYDRAPAEIVDAIARCQPDVVISFGQGGDTIALEETAYNLQDTGEVDGGVPDNRGVIRAAQPIDPAAAATRATLLPLDAIEPALEALGESPARSTDPGRYVCNNVMFADLGAMAGRGRAGFIHLPYTTDFDDATRARLGKIVAAAIQATIDDSAGR